ncbi:MAG: hypothetical protein AAFR73_12310 [Pseudomonadota bacterium]
MNTKELTHHMREAQGTTGNALLDYFDRMRADRIRKYLGATFWVTRKDARQSALHYGRLIRKMEGKS